MLRRMLILSGCLALLMLVGNGLAADPVKSGPQVGEQLPGAFHPLNINGASAGKKHCLYCEHGLNPVVMIFAREVSTPLTNLIKKVDAANAKNTGASMGSFVVFCSDADGLDKKLKETADGAKLKHTVLAIDNAAGPPEYKVARDADVTVVLYVEATVKANYTFKKGELKDADADKILADLPKILPKK